MNWRNWKTREIGWFSGSTQLEKRVECFDDEVKVICVFCISKHPACIFKSGDAHMEDSIAEWKNNRVILNLLRGSLSFKIPQ